MSLTSAPRTAGEPSCVAGIHLGRGGDHDNAAAVRRHLPSQRTCLLTLTAWETVLATHNARLRSHDSASPDVRVAARGPGSGARAVLERALRDEKIAPQTRLRGAVVARSHFDVARRIADGTAEAGVILRDTATAHGLAFTPLETERFDLVLPADSLHDRRVARPLDTLTHASSRAEITSPHGHDPRDAGTTVADHG